MKRKGEYCKHCPFAKIKGGCPRWPTDHTRYCDWVNPSHPDFKTNGASALKNIAVHRVGDPRRGKSIPIKDTPIVFPGDPPPFSSVDDISPDVDTEARDELPGPNKASMHADDETHQRVYRLAMECEHKETVQLCCGPSSRCGEAGAMPGKSVKMADCYACVSERIGLGLLN